LGLDPGANVGLVKELNSVSKDRLQDFYEYALSLRRQLSGPIFSEMQPTTPTGLRLADLQTFMEATVNLMQLMSAPERSQYWRGQRGRIKASADLAGLSARTREQLVEKIRDLLSAKYQFSYEDFKSLERKWGSLEAVFVLISRFRATPAWTMELTHLAKVFEHELKNTFPRFKFRGDDKYDAENAKGQLGPIDGPKLAHWVKRRLIAETLQPGNTNQSAQAAIEQLREEAKSTLQAHTREALPDIEIPSSTIELLTTFFKNLDPRTPPNQTLAVMETQFRATPRHILKAVAEFLAVAPDRESFTAAIRFALGVSKRLTEKVNGDMAAQIASDLRGLGGNALGSKPSGKRGILITYTTHNAKTLLEIGDAVDTSSCQNYKTGGHIETLLGYVMDAGIQAILSFVIEPGHFSSFKEFENAFAAVNAGNARIQVVDEKKEFIFTLPSGEQIKSLPVPKAFRRHILKLGRMAAEKPGKPDKPGLMLERAYQQNHTAQPLMEQHALRILKQLATDLGAQVRGQMTFHRSRNTGGIYSDAAKGIQRENYSVIVEDPIKPQNGTAR
jgi:hypothetical protein